MQEFHSFLVRVLVGDAPASFGVAAGGTLQVHVTSASEARPLAGCPQAYTHSAIAPRKTLTFSWQAPVVPGTGTVTVWAMLLSWHEDGSIGSSYYVVKAALREGVTPPTPSAPVNGASTSQHAAPVRPHLERVRSALPCGPRCRQSPARK
ncbi:MAG: hypothetical protein EOO41_05270, partial [Methanobacteriota archaeon]